MIDIIKIVSFAGLDVPDDGLTVYPPQGGELTVYPDGGYAFTPPEGGFDESGPPPVTTYYSFVMEDLDGEMSTGTFALSPREEMPDEMQDFQAWSLPELLHDEADAARLLFGGEDVHVNAGAADMSVADAYPEFTGADSFDDDVAKLLVDSHHYS